jgi:hypothetical protein
MATVITCLCRTAEHNLKVGGVPTSYHVRGNTPTGKCQAVDLVCGGMSTLSFGGGTVKEDWETDELVDERLRIIVRAVSMYMIGRDSRTWYEVLKQYIHKHTTGVRVLIHDKGSGMHAHIEIHPEYEQDVTIKP